MTKLREDDQISPKMATLKKIIPNNYIFIGKLVSHYEFDFCHKFFKLPDPDPVKIVYFDWPLRSIVSMPTMSTIAIPHFVGRTAATTYLQLCTEILHVCKSAVVIFFSSLQLFNEMFFKYLHIRASLIDCISTDEMMLRNCDCIPSKFDFRNSQLDPDSVPCGRKRSRGLGLGRCNRKWTMTWTWMWSWICSLMWMWNVDVDVDMDTDMDMAGMPNFFMSLIAIRHFEGNTSATAYLQLFKEILFCNCISANPQSIFAAVRNFKTQLFKEMLCRNCTSAYLQAKFI
jgi:hypothetical protein